MISVITTAYYDCRLEGFITSHFFSSVIEEATKTIAF